MLGRVLVGIGLCLDVAAAVLLERLSARAEDESAKLADLQAYNVELDRQIASMKTPLPDGGDEAVRGTPLDDAWQLLQSGLIDAISLNRAQERDALLALSAAHNHRKRYVTMGIVLIVVGGALELLGGVVFHA
jgi:hypothetical protein